jgi:hypothetical protein
MDIFEIPQLLNDFLGVWRSAIDSAIATLNQVLMRFCEQMICNQNYGN